jgi:hypothetical protein
LCDPKNQQWKNAINKAINSFWYDKWTNEKQIKSTLEYLEIQQNPIGTPHNILRIAFLSSVVSIGSAPISV